MRKILVVDDNPDHIELLCIMLTKLDIDCIVAYTGLEAVELAKDLLPDVIIMDWIMPSETLTGFDATRLLQSDVSTHHIPVIACSAVSERAQFVDAGCVDFIKKPFRSDVLLNTIRNYLPKTSLSPHQVD